MDNNPVITAAARTAAKENLGYDSGRYLDPSEQFEIDELAQAFDAYAAAAVAEREALIATWLANQQGGMIDPPYPVYWSEAIKAGEHLKDQTHG